MNNNDKCDIRYHVGFEIIIYGCSLSFEIDDKSLLRLISRRNMEFNEMEFRNSNKKSILSGNVYTTELGFCYNFILFEFKELIIKTLVGINSIEDLRIEDDIKFSILNKDELREAKIPITAYPGMFAVLEPKIPVITREDFQNHLSNINMNKGRFENTLLWQYISYSITNIEKGKTKFNIISQYRLLWTSFNSLYSETTGIQGDKKALEKYSQKEYVIKYFEQITNNYESYQLLKTLAGEGLSLRGSNGNVSEKLKECMENSEYSGISKYALFCLYAIRNALIHGSATNEQKLCRVGFSVLNPLIKKSIKQEMINGKV